MFPAHTGRVWHFAVNNTSKPRLFRLGRRCITPSKFPVSRVEEPAKARPACLPWIGDMILEHIALVAV
jgi:hypothetical protein